MSLENTEYLTTHFITTLGQQQNRFPHSLAGFEKTDSSVEKCPEKKRETAWPKRPTDRPTKPSCVSKRSGRGSPHVKHSGIEYKTFHSSLSLSHPMHLFYCLPYNTQQFFSLCCCTGFRYFGNFGHKS